MKIIEARDGFIKVETEQKPAVSSFLKVYGENKSYIAQVIQVKNNGKNYVAYAKFLFVYDMDFSVYDKTLPDTSANVEIFPFENLAGIFNQKNPVIVGVNGDNVNITVDRNSLNRFLVSVDSSNIVNNFVNNISKQLGLCSKVLVIDTLGTLTGDKKVAGVDFKLPINTESLEFIYEDCLNDATSESKALIKDIFRDLAEYSKSVPFVPFSALKTIVDDMVDNSHIFKLLVLKNKLAKFEKLGYFASTSAEADNFDKILNDNTEIVDLSKLDTLFLNRYLGILLSKIGNVQGDKQLILQASNSISKLNLKNIVTNTDLPVIYVTHSKFKYLGDIKSFFKNFIVENTFANKEHFKLYTPFINALEADDYLLVGEGTNFIPLLSKTVEIITPKEVIITGKSEIEETFVEDEQTDFFDETLSEEGGLPEEEPVYSADESFDAIDKKSDELIQKSVSDISEMQMTDNINIFENSDDRLEEEVLNEEPAEEEEEPAADTDMSSAETIEQTEVQNIQENDGFVEDEPEFVDSVVSDELEDNLIADSVENEEIMSEPEPLLDTEAAEETVLEETPIELTVQTDFDEYHTTVDTTKVIDIEEEQQELEEIQQQDDTVEAEVNNFEEAAVEPEIINIQEENNDLNPEIIDVPELADLVDDESIDEISEQSLNQEDIEVSENDEVAAEEPFSETVQEEDSIPVMPMVQDDEPAIQEDIVSDDLLDEIVELDADDVDENTILVEMDDDSDLNTSDLIVEDDSVEKEIIEDVDKVYTTIKDDTISDSDLDFIDELNDLGADDSIGVDDNLSDDAISTDEGLEILSELPQDESEETFLEPIEELSVKEENSDNDILETRSNTTTTVPVYDADIPQEDKVISDPISQGDTVVHAKYGTGVVEKMIKYGNKELFSINFDDVGRRLLDPTLTEIKKA